MRSFSFQRQAAVIRTLKEPPKPKRRINLDRVLYFAIITLVLFFLGRYAYKTLASVEGNGQILMDKIEVNFTNDIRIQQLMVTEGDTVNWNQPLFSYLESDFDNSATLVLRSERYRNTGAQDSLRLKFEIQQKQIELDAAIIADIRLQKLEEQVYKLVMLDVETRTKLEQVREERFGSRTQVQLLNQELALLQAQYALIRQLQNGRGGSSSGSGSGDYFRWYESPIGGIIGQINKNEQEACYRTESVLTIHNTEQVYIKAYFELKDLEAIQQNARVSVLLEDGSSSYGMIRKIYVSTYEAPEEFQKTYEPTERNLLAEIVPLNEVDRAHWARFHKLNVKIRLGRFDSKIEQKPIVEAKRPSVDSKLASD